MLSREIASACAYPPRDGSDHEGKTTPDPGDYAAKATEKAPGRFGGRLPRAGLRCRLSGARGRGGHEGRLPAGPQLSRLSHPPRVSCRLGRYNDGDDHGSSPMRMADPPAHGPAEKLLQLVGVDHAVGEGRLKNLTHLF